MHETVFLHRPSRTLIATDLVFNQRSDDFSGGVRWLMRLNGAVDRFGPTRLFRHVFTGDRRALAQSLEPVFAWDFDRVIMSHGHILETGGKQALQAAFAWL